MANELMTVEFESLSGIMVKLDAATVRNTLTRGNGNVSDQEVAMFLRTCQAKKLDPLENGEVYLIKYPWSAIFRLIGKAINKEVLEQIGEVKSEQGKLKAEVDGLREKMDAHEVTRQEEKIVEARIRILRFGDECREHVRHSKEHWDQTMRDITQYEKYCDAHPEFENNVTVETSKYLKELYHQCMVENDFL